MNNQKPLIGLAFGLIGGAGLAFVALVLFFGLDYCPGLPCASETSVHSSLFPVTAPNTTEDRTSDDDNGNPNYYIRQDLRAQESVARATNAIVWLSAFTLVLSTAGTALLFITLKATRDAVATANQANEIMRHEQRAWLDFSVKHWGEAQVYFQDGISRSILWFPKLEVENRGKTPATNVWFRTRVFQGKSFSGDGVIEEVIAERSKNNTSEGYIVFPDNTHTQEKWGDGGLLYVTGETGVENSINSWWFVSVLTSETAGDMRYTAKIFSMNVPEMSEFRESEHGGRPVVSLTGLHQSQWSNKYT